MSKDTIDGDVIITARESDGDSHIFATNRVSSAQVLAKALRAAGCDVDVRKWTDKDRVHGISAGYYELRV
jgi:hypothetical protein